MGGEPLCPENEFLTMLLITEIRNKIPDLKIYVWTGYTLEELEHKEGRIKNILKSIDFLVDGPFKEELKDCTLHMKGSSNQRVIDMQTVDFLKNI